jgi:NADH-quinone oxidoreductase subunit A
LETVLWPLGVYFLAVVGLLAIILFLSSRLGERHDERATGEQYESGMKLTGSAQMHMSVNFYLIAVFFVIFDLEALFIFAWAIALREVGWTGFIEIVIFIGVLLAGLAYLWRGGTLDLVSQPRR